MSGVALQFPISVHSLALFITYLAYEGLKHNSITSVFLRLSYFHELYDYNNPVTTFYISKLMMGIQRTQADRPAQYRKPISLPILEAMVKYVAQHMSHYDVHFYTAIFTMAYYGCLRLGELVLSTEVAHVPMVNHMRLEWNRTAQPVYHLFKPRYKFSHGIKATLRYLVHPGVACPVIALSSGQT